MRMLVRRALALGVATAMLAGCSEGGHPRLVQPGVDDWWGFIADEVGAGEPLVLSGEIRLCLDRPGAVELVEVSFEHTDGGLRVDAFATRPVGGPPIEPGSPSPTLWDFGYAGGAQVVEQACSSDGGESGSPDQAQLGLQVSKPTSGTARGANLLIRYRSGPDTHTLREEFELVLCEGEFSEPRWAEECAHWPVERYATTSGG